jgi:RNA polymerase sigma factor (sigma-70 family)
MCASRNYEVVSGARSDEDGLLRLIAAGDEEAFSVFYAAHREAVLGFFRARVSDRELVFDLTAETFAAVVVGAASYTGESSASGVAWLYGIARNKLRESLRTKQVEDAARRRLQMEPIALDDTDLQRVDELTRGRESALERELRALPEATRQALLARLVEERDYDEIAERLQCSEQVVRQRVHRGLKRLRAGLKGAP